MNAQVPEWQGQFSSGFSSSGNPVDVGMLFLLLGIVSLLIAAVYVFLRWRNSRPTEDGSVPGVAVKPRRAKYVPVPGKFNPLQQKIIQDLIDEFRKQEPAAHAIPSSVLERYTEFFFLNKSKLETPDRAVEEFLDVHYPITVGLEVELDFQSSGSVHLVKTKVIAVDLKSVTVEFDSQVPDFLTKGMKLSLNYSQGKHFLQGDTAIQEIHQSQGIVLRRPTHILLTTERRYPRIPLNKATGSLHDTKSAFQIHVKVLDLSPEGVRVQVGRPLDKNRSYQLVFEASDGTKSRSFGPLECVPSRTYMTGSGTLETGLAFLYVSTETKREIWGFMKALFQFQAAQKLTEED